ncbi:MAG: CAP domain-containing protein [Oscillospiraceae bacterium]|jgi:uncharacterized protein YkwD|nr:CAP domain-containing protein [Oscillospiraceae bacterium]
MALRKTFLALAALALLFSALSACGSSGSSEETTSIISEVFSSEEVVSSRAVVASPESSALVSSASPPSQPEESSSEIAASSETAPASSDAASSEEVVSLIETPSVETFSAADSSGEFVPDVIPPAESVQADTVTENAAMAQQVLALINQERTAAGLTSLQMDATLNQGAKMRVAECFSNLPDSFSHTRPDGRDCFSVFEDIGYTAYTRGENLVANQIGSSAREVYEQWKDSPGHHKNYMSADFLYCGLVFIEKRGEIYSLIGAHIFAG